MGKVKTKSFIICYIAGVLTGILIGVSIFNILISYRVDTYFNKIANLESIIEDKDARLQSLEKSINKNNNNSYIVKNIEINLVYEEEINENDTIQIEKEIREKYNMLVGKEVKEIDSDMVVEVVHKRIFRMSEKEYQLNLNRLIMAETLKVWVKVTTLEKI